MIAKEHIEDWLDRVSERNGEIEREDAVFLFVQARHLVEERGEKDKYRIVEFYGDWMVHPQLDRSEVCLGMLRDVTAVISRNWDKTGNNIVSSISEVIGIQILRSQLIELFESSGLPVIIFQNEDNWRGFITMSFPYFAGKKILFPTENPSGRARRIRAEMMALRRPNNFWVESLEIINFNEVLHWQVQLMGDKVIKMRGPILHS